MAIVKFRKGKWVLRKSKHIPDWDGVGAARFLAATPSSDGKTYTGRGVKPLSTVTVFVNGAQAGTAVADASGAWSYTFDEAPDAGAVIGWDGVISAPTVQAPLIT